MTQDKTLFGKKPPRDDPYDSLKNIHLDVHGIRRDIRDAIAKSEAKILAAIAKIAPAPGGDVVTEADKALAGEIRTIALQFKNSVQTLDDQTPDAAEPGV